MASESTDQAVSLSLPSDLAEWVDRQAAAADTDRETVLVELLAAHRAADAMEDSVVTAEDLESEVQAIVDDRVETLERDFMDKLADVRERVVQVKRETDAKAPADHDHPDLEAGVEDLASMVADLDDALDATRETLGSRIEANDEDVAAVEDSLADAREKLTTLAHAVTDIREWVARERDRTESLRKLRRQAAEHDVTRAACQACGRGVTVALMTDAECPHCGTAVTDVEPKEGFLGNPRLVPAPGIEAGEGDG